MPPLSLPTRLQPMALHYVRDRTALGEFRGETPRSQTSILLHFASTVGPDLPVRALTRDHISAWRATRLHLQPSTQRTQLSAVHAFCTYLVDIRVLDHDPSARLRGPRQPRSVPRGLHGTQVARLYARGLPDRRAHLVVSLMVQEGLRASDIANVELGDIDFTDRTLFVRRSKGNTQRVLPITAETWTVMASYLAENNVRSGALIFNRRHPGRAITANYLSHQLSEWLYAAGIKERPHDGKSGHALRHTCATDMLKAGAHPRDVQEAMGHASMATTERYMPWVVKGLRDAMEGRSYRVAERPEPT